MAKEIFLPEETYFFQIRKIRNTIRVFGLNSDDTRNALKKLIEE